MGGFHVLFIYLFLDKTEERIYFFFIPLELRSVCNKVKIKVELKQRLKVNRGKIGINSKLMDKQTILLLLPK